MLQIIIPVLIGAVIAAIIAGFIAHSAGRSYERKQYDSKVGSEEKAREIIDEALKTAETKKREALLEAKEESLKTKMSWKRNQGKKSRTSALREACIKQRRKR